MNRGALKAGWLCAALASVGVLGGPVASAPATVSLGVSGRSSSTPSVAAAGSFVAVAWGASSQGKADVFVAVSRDGGATYGAPVQANRIRGEARLGGELPPRVALRTAAGAAAPEIAVLWTARGATTQIKIARSRDGGKSFAPPVMLQSAAAAGDRGWPALSLDRQGTAHAVWLDHRGLAGSPRDRVGPCASGRRTRRRIRGGIRPLLRGVDRGKAIAGARADQERLLLLQDRDGDRPGRRDLRGMAPRLSRGPA